MTPAVDDRDDVFVEVLDWIDEIQALTEVVRARINKARKSNGDTNE